MFWFVQTQKKVMVIQSNRYLVSGNEEPNHVLVMLTKKKPFSSVIVEEGMALKMHDPKMIKTFFKTNLHFLSPNSINNTNNLPEFDQKQPYHASSFVRLNLPGDCFDLFLLPFQSMADDRRPIPIPPPNKTFGIPCRNISGQRKMALFHRSDPNSKLTYCSEVMSYIQNYGFKENTETSTVDTVHFMYDPPSPRRRRSAIDRNPNPTPKLPRSNIDGLHPYTYKGFLAAINHYLQNPRPEELFIIR